MFSSVSWAELNNHIWTQLSPLRGNCSPVSAGADSWWDQGVLPVTRSNKLTRLPRQINWYEDDGGKGKQWGTAVVCWSASCFRHSLVCIQETGSIGCPRQADWMTKGATGRRGRKFPGAFFSPSNHPATSIRTLDQTTRYLNTAIGHPWWAFRTHFS